MFTRKALGAALFRSWCIVMLAAFSACSGSVSQAVLPQTQSQAQPQTQPQTQTLADVPTANGLLPLSVAPLAAPQAGKILHVVYILQENRTFDNVFGGPNALPNVDAANAGYMSNGRLVTLTSTGVRGATDPSNSYATWIAACNAPQNAQWTIGQPAPCRMNGFDIGSSNAKQSPFLAYSYMDYSLTKSYFDMATKYAVADRFFASHNSESYTAHQFLFNAQSGGTVDSVDVAVALRMPLYNIPGLAPWGCDSPDNTRVGQFASPSLPLSRIVTNSVFPCFTYRSLPDLLNAKNLNWRVYEPWLKYNIDSLDSIKSIRYSNYFPAVKTTLNGNAYFRHPVAQFGRDLNSKSPYNRLAAVTWFLPSPDESDHAGPLVFGAGAGYVANLVNQIGRSPDWSTTVIFVTWDDWGGVYDHVPPYVVRDASGVGFRVPLLVISPYTKPGCVIHANNEFGTILRFTEDAFGLGSLYGVDNSPYLGDLNACFNWTSPPQAFRSINDFGFNPQAAAKLEQQAIRQGISAVSEEQ